MTTESASQGHMLLTPDQNAVQFIGCLSTCYPQHHEPRVEADRFDGFSHQQAPELGLSISRCSCSIPLLLDATTQDCLCRPGIRTAHNPSRRFERYRGRPSLLVCLHGTDGSLSQRTVRDEERSASACAERRHRPARLYVRVHDYGRQPLRLTFRFALGAFGASLAARALACLAGDPRVIHLVVPTTAQAVSTRLGHEALADGE